MTRDPLYRRLDRPQGRSGRVLKILPPLGFDPQTVQLVASRYTDYAIPAHATSEAVYKLICYVHVQYTHHGPQEQLQVTATPNRRGSKEGQHRYTLFPSPQLPVYSIHREGRTPQRNIRLCHQTTATS
jgi:hypothetical protein